jgi:hypothetical protein
MLNKLKTIVVLLFVSINIFNKLGAQDINFTVSVISQRVQLTDKSIFNALQNSITEFLNGRRWSKDKILPQEVIKCNLLIDITEYDPSGNRFKADFQIQSIRPVFNSNYTTLLANIRDLGAVFEYQQFQAMDYQENNNVYNLTGLLAFYAYVVLGYDYDSFGELAGTPYFQLAKGIIDASQSIQGWRPNDGTNNQNKFYLIDNLLNDRLKPLRQTIYMYHRKGLDIMHKDVVKARKEIEESLKNIQEICRLLPNAMVVRNFFFVKNKEIIDIFKESPVAEKNRVVDMLKKMDVANAAEYDKIRKS